MDLSLDSDELDLDVSSLTDEQLAVLAFDVAYEQQQRAVAGRDLAAISDRAFAKAFSGSRVAPPWLDGGLLVCPGLLVDKSKQSHDSTFVTVAPAGGDSHWVWESDSCVSDEIRKLPGKLRRNQSVTLVAVADNTEADMVSMQKRQGRLKVVKVASYEVRRGELVQVATRAKPATGGYEHR